MKDYKRGDRIILSGKLMVDGTIVDGIPAIVEGRDNNENLVVERFAEHRLTVISEQQEDESILYKGDPKKFGM